MLMDRIPIVDVFLYSDVTLGWLRKREEIVLALFHSVFVCCKRKYFCEALIGNTALF